MFFDFPAKKFEICTSKHDHKMFRISLADGDGQRFITIHLCHKECSIFEEDARKLMFEMTLGSNIFERIDLFHKYFNIFQARDKILKK